MKMRIKDIVVKSSLTADSVRSMCIANGYYTNGDSEAYENLLYKVDNTVAMSDDELCDIAEDIYNHSDVEKLAYRSGCSYKDVMDNILFELLRLRVYGIASSVYYENNLGNYFYARRHACCDWRIVYADNKNGCIREACETIDGELCLVSDNRIFDTQIQAETYIEENFKYLH